MALLLAQRNIPSIVLEGYDYLDTRLRATQYGVPATRVFRRAGILEDIRAASIGSFPTIKWRRVSDKEVLTSIDMSCVKDHPDRMTILQLGEIIKIIYKHCLERAKGLIEIKFQHRVANIGQDEQRAWADVEVGEEKRHIRFEADYIVGCDGATSAVRKSLFGREWPGQIFDCQFIVQNVSFDFGISIRAFDGSETAGRETENLFALNPYSDLQASCHGTCCHPITHCRCTSQHNALNPGIL